MKAHIEHHEGREMGSANDLPSLHAVALVLRRKSSLLWGVALLLQIAAILGGGLLPLMHQPGYVEIVAVAIAGIVAGMIRWWSDYVRGSGESLFSKVEGENQLGWRIPPKMNLDVYAKANLRAAAKLTVNASNYWASTEPSGARRGVECVQESSWWSEHLARGLGILALFVSIVLLLVGFTALFSVLGAPMKVGEPTTVARAILSVLAVTFTGGLLRIGFDYLSFASKAGNVSARALDLRNTSAIEVIDAARLLHDYQVARSKAPPILNWYHKLRQEKLNALWKRLGTEI